MKILQTVKYYAPSKGGMESVVENIVAGGIENSSAYHFTVYANSHVPIFKKEIQQSGQLNSIKEFTPFLLRSQPLSIRYASLRKLIKDTDIVHHHYPFPNMELALLRNADILKGKKLIVTWHANIKNSRWSWIGKYYNPIIKKLLDMADYIVVTSPQLIQSSDILKNYENKLKVIPLSFDPEISHKNCVARQFPQKRNFRLLFVGKLRAYKGLEFLIGAVTDLDVELTIVGDGENEQALRKLVQDQSLEHKVKFLKNITNQNLVTVYNEADLFILPSINEAEAFGVVQLEAMSNGLPVINTNLESGVPFVSLHGISGLTVEPKNSDALKAAIVQLINDQQLYEEFSKNALERSKEFTRIKMSEAYLNLYNS